MGEFELLARIRERLPVPSPVVRLGSGDDAAITLPPGATATSVDALVEGVHFRRDQASLRQIGHKALATALSDLAAMGAKAGEAYVALGLPSDLDEDDCMELLDGLAALAATTRVSLVGGDLTRAAQLFLAITVVGHADATGSLVDRAGAGEDNAVLLTGELGGATAGLWLLEDPSLSRQSDHADELRARQLEPTPRLVAGQALAEVGATAMIDVSDGLGADAGHLARQSGVALRIDAAAVPIAPAAADLARAAGRNTWQLLGGGEDYELLACLPASRVEQAKQAVRDAEGIELTQIGEATRGSGVEIRLPGGQVLEPAGFDQLA